MANADTKLTKREAEEEALSALLDGELSHEQEEDLRRRIAEDPELAERCAEFAEVGGVLQRLAAPTPNPERLDRIRQGLQARIDAEQAAGAEAQTEAQVIALPVRSRAAFVAAAALAAALALYWVMDPGTDLEPTVSPPAPVLAEVEVVLPAPTLSPSLSPSPDAVDTPSLAASPRPAEFGVQEAELLPSAPRMAQEAPEGLQPVAVAEPVRESTGTGDPAVLPDADEQLAIALDYGMLADFDVISNLELLESLDELATVESM